MPVLEKGGLRRRCPQNPAGGQRRGTGRAGNEGLSIMFATGDDTEWVRRIENNIKATITKFTATGQVKVKAAGGIRDWATCKAMIDAGAQRIGTSSSLKILEEFEAEEK